MKNWYVFLTYLAEFAGESIRRFLFLGTFLPRFCAPRSRRRLCQESLGKAVRACAAPPPLGVRLGPGGVHVPHSAPSPHVFGSLPGTRSLERAQNPCSVLRGGEDPQCQRFPPRLSGSPPGPSLLTLVLEIRCSCGLYYPALSGARLCTATCPLGRAGGRKEGKARDTPAPAGPAPALFQPRGPLPCS